MYQIGYKKSTKWWVVVMAIVILLLFLYFVGILNWFLSIFGNVSNPLQGGMYQASGAISGVRSRADLQRENDELKQKLQQAATDVSQLKNLEEENQILRDQLHFAEGQAYDYVAARIISASAQDDISALIINRGTNDGIKVGLPVIAGEGVLIGEIIEVKNNMATLLLATDQQSKIAATVQNKDRTVGVVEGEHGISLVMSMIPRDEKVVVGETIITSGMQAGIPRGLLIGLVDRVDSTSSELFDKAYLYPLVDYQELNIVTVLIPQN